MVHTTRWAIGRSNHLRFEAHGTRRAQVRSRRVVRQARGLPGRRHRQSRVEDARLESTPNNYERFVRSIESGEVDQPDILRGAEVQAYLDACERSAKTGKWAKIRSYR